MKKLGFGLMRLPLVNDDFSQPDKTQLCDMVDLFLEKGFQYFDTAWFYHNGQSEAAVKKCLAERYPHSAFLLADKMPLVLIHQESELEEYFSAQLARCGARYFDYYLIHGMGGNRRKAAEDMHVFAFLSEKKKAGFVKQIGFSFHDTADVTERLDKGLLDFGLLIQPTDIAKYDYLSLPAKDSWGVILRRDSPLAAKRSIRAGDLAGEPLIFSRQVLEERSGDNELARWFGPAWNDLNIVTTFNLCYNAAVMAKQGVGCVVSLDKLADTSADSPLCFRPLEPRLESGLDIVWKKYQVFSPAAEAFLDRLRERCAENPGR